MTEKYLFGMPEFMEPFLAATAVVQAFCQNKDCEVTIACPNISLQIFSPVFPKKTSFVRSINALRGDFDLEVDFNEKAAYKIARRTEKHIVQMFGILIGADAVNSYPTVLGDFSKMEKGTELFDVLVWGLSNELGAKFCSEVLNKMHKSYTFIHEGLAKKEEDNAHYVSRIVREHKTIVGVRSSATYLACSYRKSVVELYDTQFYKNWLSKWANKKYRMIYSDNPTTELITSALEAVWEASGSEESTGQTLSTATGQ